MERLIEKGYNVEFNFLDNNTRSKISRVLFSLPRIPNDEWEQLRLWSTGKLEESDLSNHIEAAFNINKASIGQVVRKKINHIFNKNEKQL